ncbi:hypothetical protein MOUN0_M03950 [Monosporozyma unispora]
MKKVTKSIKEADKHMREANKQFKDVSRENRAVVTQLQIESDSSASIISLLNQQNSILTNINEIIPKIMNTIVDHLLSKRDNVAGNFDDNMVKIITDVYNLFHKQHGIAYPEMRSMLQTVFETYNDMNDSVTKNC